MDTEDKQAWLEENGSLWIFFDDPDGDGTGSCCMNWISGNSIDNYVWDGEGDTLGQAIDSVYEDIKASLFYMCNI